MLLRTALRVSVVLALLLTASCVRLGEDAYGRLPHGAGFRNVRDFGAKGDGVTDDTQAFIRALESGRGGKGEREKAPASVYVPSGTYVLSDTLIVWRATLLAGDADSPPTLLLKANSPGFGDPGKPKPFIVTYLGYNTDPAERGWTVRTNEEGGSTNNTFFITLRHIHLQIGPGNPGAWGLYWLVAQQTALRNVTIDAGDGQGCMKSMLWGGGGAISHLKLLGGDYGWHVKETSQWAVRSVELRGQRKASLCLNGVWNFALLDLRFRKTAPMQVFGGNVSLLNSSFDDIVGGSAIETKDSSLVLANVTARGVREVVKGALPAAAPGPTKVPLWAAGSVMVNGRELTGATHGLREIADLIPRDLPSPAYPLPGRRARSVTEFGAVGDGQADDTAAIQRAIAECRDVFFPQGTYLVSDSLRLRSHSRLFGEMFSMIQLKADSSGFEDPASRKPLLEIPDDPSATITVCHLMFRMLAPGGIYTDWRAGEKSAMMDVFFGNDSKTQQLNWRISGTGGGFFENGWNPAPSGEGLEITSVGRKWMYAIHQEHYPKTALILRGARHLVALVLQFEGSVAPYVRLENCEDIAIFQAIAGHWSGPPGPLFHVVGGRNIALFNSLICNNRRVVTEEPDGWDAGPSSPDRGFARQTAWIKR